MRIEGKRQLYFALKGHNFLSKIGFVCLLIILANSSARADKAKRFLKKARHASAEFAHKASEGTVYKFKVDTVVVNVPLKKVSLKMKETFSYIPFRPENTSQYYNWYDHFLGRRFRKYSVTIESMGKEISELIPNSYRDNPTKIDSSRFARPTKNAIPIVRNISKNLIPSEGLTNRNIAMWHSHGW